MGEAEAAPADPAAAPAEKDCEDPNETIHRNTYNPQLVKLVLEEPEPEDDKVQRQNFSVLLTDNNAPLLNDTTRVGWRGRINYSIREQLAMQNRLRATKDEIQRDTNRMLETVISSIIILASGNICPLENYIYTELYLDNIKDPFGDHPPNLSNFLHHLSFLKQKNDIDFEKSYFTEDDSSVVLMKIQNRNRLGRVPVRISPDDDTPVADYRCKRLKKRINRLQCPEDPEEEAEPTVEEGATEEDAAAE